MLILAGSWLAVGGRLPGWRARERPGGAPLPRSPRGHDDAVRGLHVPLVTPFDEAGAVDLAALERLAGEVLDGGADGLVALATTAEASSLDERERDAVIGVCARGRRRARRGADRRRGHQRHAHDDRAPRGAGRRSTA